MALPTRHEGTRFPVAAIPAGTPSPARQVTNARLSSSFSNCPTPISHAICWQAMSQPIPDTPPCVAYCSRIDLNPSRFAAVLWFAWLALVCVVVLTGVALPLAPRLVLSLAVLLPGIRCIRSFVLLAGSQAVRTIEWSEEGEFGVRLGPQLTPHAGHTCRRFVPAGSSAMGFAVHDTCGAPAGTYCRRRSGRGEVSAPVALSDDASASGIRARRRPRCYHPAQGLKCVTRH